MQVDAFKHVAGLEIIKFILFNFLIFALEEV